VNWIKKNKLSTLLIVLLVLFLGKSQLPVFFGTDMMSLSRPATLKMSGNAGISSFETGVASSPYVADYAPTTQTNRMVVQETSLSFVVLKVQETVDKITERAKQDGGYMVSSNLSQPEEAPFATVVIRIPSDKLKETLSYFRGLAVKVSSENILGTDVTDQYIDIQAHLETLNLTKSKFESILDTATAVQDILTVQRELINLQNQIDSLKGQQKYLDQTAKLAKVTIYLSSDELALPYAPTDTFRPNVIFKLAVRSLVGALRGFATMLIWVAVFGVIWVPVLAIVVLIRRFFKRRTS
jgi:hypothetical protein